MHNYGGDDKMENVFVRIYCILEKIVLLLLLIQIPATLLTLITFFQPKMGNLYSFIWSFCFLCNFMILPLCCLLMLEHNNGLFETIAVKYLCCFKCIFPHLYNMINENKVGITRQFQYNRRETTDQTKISVEVKRIEAPQLEESDSD